jgi:hypothetical protein
LTASWGFGKLHSAERDTISNCARWAFRWRERVLASLAGHLTGLTGSGSAVNRPADTSRKLDTDRHRHARHLALAGFRDEIARLERDERIRMAHQDGISVRDIAGLVHLSRPGSGRSSPYRPVVTSWTRSVPCVTGGEWTTIPPTARLPTPSSPT